MASLGVFFVPFDPSVPLSPVMDYEAKRLFGKRPVRSKGWLVEEHWLHRPLGKL